ncbi:MAG: hypothetical protein ACI4DR_09925 [Roseburia sp.]
MGVIEKISCQACGAVWECETGAGRNQLLLESVMPCFPSYAQEELLTYAKKRSTLPGFCFSYQLAGCADCGQVVSVPVIVWEKQEQKTVGPCPTCGRKVSLFHALDAASCPVCQKVGALQTINIGLWD